MRFHPGVGRQNVWIGRLRWECCRLTVHIAQRCSRWLCCLEYLDSRGFDCEERADDSDELPARPMHRGTLDIYSDWRSVCAAQWKGTRIQRMAFRSVQ